MMVNFLSFPFILHRPNNESDEAEIPGILLVLYEAESPFYPSFHWFTNPDLTDNKKKMIHILRLWGVRVVSERVSLYMSLLLLYKSSIYSL